MKFIHIADVHLGAHPDAGDAYTAKRPQELWDSFSRVVALCEKEKTDIMLIAGDLFHRQPLLRELKEVNHLFSTLSHTQVVLIAGNRDYIKKDSYYLNFEWNKNVHPLMESEMGCAAIPKLKLGVYGFSYHTREITEQRYQVKAPRKFQYEILLAHGGDDRHVPIRRDLLEQSGFDYIAMGYIHKPQELIPNYAVYAGALEPVDKNDTGQHGYVRGEITESGIVAEFVPSAQREYVHLVLRMNDTVTNASVKGSIKDAVEKRGIDNIYKFSLKGPRDPEVIFDTKTMDVYGNILEIVDETYPAYDYQFLYDKNRDNVIGRYIAAFQGCEEGSMEYQALQEGVQALLSHCL